jgi:hypothetical protein
MWAARFRLRGGGPPWLMKAAAARKLMDGSAANLGFEIVALPAGDPPA